MKKFSVILGMIMLIFILGFAIFLIWLNSIISDNLSKKEIFATVDKNYETILENITKNDFSDCEKINGIKEIYSDYGIVDFYCGGSGIGSSTSYYGFYYSVDDAPKDTWCGTSFGDIEKLKQDGKGFSIKYANDDNFYYTEKIRDNFYYYEAHF